MAKAPARTAGQRNDSARRKLVEFDAETWHALTLLSRDSLKTVQELADEAFTDLLRKHHRPVTLKDALKQSARMQPANDPAPATSVKGRASTANRPQQRRRRR
jgi:hypothetical protein